MQPILINPWAPSYRATLVALGSVSSPESSLHRILVQGASYEFGDQRQYYVVAAVQHPRTQRWTFVRAGTGRDIFVADGSEVWLCTTLGWHFQITGFRSWYTTSAAIGLDVAVRDFLQKTDWAELNKRTPENHFAFSLIPAAPAGFFGEEDGVGGSPALAIELGPVFNGVGAVEGGIIRLDYYSPELKMPASFWIDFAARKVVRGVVGGHEMKMGADGAPGTAVDGTNLVTPAMQAWYDRHRSTSEKDAAKLPSSSPVGPR